MCGIIGYIGKEEAIQNLYSGLQKLEYRGYDSCGSAIFKKDNDILHFRHLGAPSEVEDIPREESHCGIAHTRWATHGRVTQENTHPHHCQYKKVYLVHNGVIENSDEIKKKLKVKNYKFYGDTDSEVLANLISLHYSSGNYLEAIELALKEVEGTYGLGIIFADNPSNIYAVKRSSSLILGLGEGESFLVSDINALPLHIKKVVYLDDGNIVCISKDNFSITNLDHSLFKEWDKIKKIKKRSDNRKLENYSTYLEKEIFEQADCIRKTTRGRFGKNYSSIIFGGINPEKDIKRIVFLGCGTAYHAGLLGKYYMENIAGIPATVEISSEYRYKNNPTEEGTLVVAISQSGETIDTLSALKEAQGKGLDTIAITNTVMSSIARQAPEGIYQRIGPEISVASTKAFTSQLTILLMLAIKLGMKNNINAIEAEGYIKQLRCLPELIDHTLEICKESARSIAAAAQLMNCASFLGRQYMYPIALEAALKVKELAYISTHGYASGEIKHGPIASIERHATCIFIAPEEGLREKNIISMREIKARDGRINLIKQEGQEFPEDCYDRLIEIPKAKDYILPILAVIPMQLFSLYLAQIKKYNVDRPRNLAKSVTVE
jgi:glucosamine--fructose-6-phosphate aminotransferase (isomerizing)